jgi:hypothetical protein
MSRFIQVFMLDSQFLRPFVAAPIVALHYLLAPTVILFAMTWLNHPHLLPLAPSLVTPHHRRPHAAPDCPLFNLAYIFHPEFRRSPHH